MKNEMVLGYLAIARTSNDFSRETESRKFTKQTAQIAPITLRSVVTQDNEIPSEHIAYSEAHGDRVVGVVRVPVLKVQAAQVENTNELLFRLEPVPVLAIVSVQGKITLLDLDDDGTEQALPRDGQLVGIITAPGVFHLSAFDSVTERRLNLGYVCGSTLPAEFTVPGEKWDGAGNRSDEADKTFAFESWAGVALAYRAKFQAAQEKVQERRMKQSEIEAAELVENGRFEAEQREQAAQREKELVPSVRVDDGATFELLKHLAAKEGHQFKSTVEEDADGVYYLVSGDAGTMHFLEQAENMSDGLDGLNAAARQKQLNSMLGKPVLA